MFLHSASEVQRDVFTQWDYFPPCGVLDPLTSVMKSVSLPGESQEARRSAPLSIRRSGVKRAGVGCFLNGL